MTGRITFAANAVGEYTLSVIGTAGLVRGAGSIKRSVCLSVHHTERRLN